MYSELTLWLIGFAGVQCIWICALIREVGKSHRENNMIHAEFVNKIKENCRQDEEIRAFSRQVSNLANENVQLKVKLQSMEDSKTIQ